MARERGADPLQTTALINELYLKMVDLKRVNWQNRAHFYALCARQMRRILTDLYRAGVCQKRGGNQELVVLDVSTICASEPRRDLMAIDEALERLAQMDARKGQVVELRFFGGLSVKETAEVLRVSVEIRSRRLRPSSSFMTSTGWQVFFNCVNCADIGMIQAPGCLSLCLQPADRLCLATGCIPPLPRRSVVSTRLWKGARRPWRWMWTLPTLTPIWQLC
jgi:RNA polymerase sigma factor (TIGR02999 family)